MKWPEFGPDFGGELGAVECLLVGIDDGRDSLPSLLECHFKGPFTAWSVGETAADLPRGGNVIGVLLGEPEGVNSGVRLAEADANCRPLLLISPSTHTISNRTFTSGPSPASPKTILWIYWPSSLNQCSKSSF